MVISIDAREIPVHAGDDPTFLIYLDDLDSFTTMWHYSNLTYSDLNLQLRLTITLRSPRTSSYSDPHIPKVLQRGFILPFSRVESLHSFHISGNPKPVHSLTSRRKRGVDNGEAGQKGKIYYRTAVAKKMLRERVEVRRLVRVAMVYLPRDETVKAKGRELGIKRAWG